MPSVMAITCSLKIWLLCSSEVVKDTWCYTVNWINCILNLIALLIVYSLGRSFGYCWKHRSLCRIALWGYLWYAWFLLIRVDRAEVLGTAILYVLIVLVVTAFYAKDLK